MKFNEEHFTKEYQDYAMKMLEAVIAYPSFLTEYKENTPEPFGKANREVLEYVIANAQKDGFKAVNVDNYAGHIEFGEGELLGILCHLDVVPVDKSEWATDPFKLHLADDKLFGRGVMDDKGPLVATYVAIKMLKDEGFKPKMKIRLIFGCDEESGSRCLARYYQKQEKPKTGFSPDAEFPLINGEKGMMSYDVLVEDDLIEEFSAGQRYNIVPAVAKMKIKKNLDNEFLAYLKENNYEGSIQDGYYVIKGLAAHAMCPQKGINAAYLLFDFLNKYSDSKLAKFINEYYLFDVYGKKLGYDDYDEEMKELTSNFAIVDIKNGKGKLGVNCRVPKNEDFKLVEEKVDAATSKYGYSYKVLGTSERHYVSPDSKLIKTLMNVYVNATGNVNAKPFSIGGGTYAREIEGAVAFGPLFEGREDVCHIANEYMYLEDFYKLVEIYYLAIKELTK